MAVVKTLGKLVEVVWTDHQANDLWQRIIKCSIASVAAVIAVITPQAMATLGTATFLAPMTTVFAHPGQRLGMMIESLLLILLGSLTGLAWSLFGIYLSSLVIDDNVPAAYAIRAMFLLVSVIVHGYIRSSSPRLFMFVSFLLIASIILLLGSSKKVTLVVFTTVYYPHLVGAACALVVNISIFPELSSSYLGISTIDTLCETMDTLTRATHWFVTPGGDCERREELIEATRSKTTVKSAIEQPKKRKKKGWIAKFLEEFPNPFKSSQARYRKSSIPVHLTSIASLTGEKAKLRTQLTRCKAAQKEVNFEISFSALAPGSMKPLSTSYMSNLVQSTITLVNACENKYLVLENDTSTIGDDLTVTSTLTHEEMTKMTTKEDYLRKLEDAKPMREIEASSVNLLESILERVREPVQEFERSLHEAVVLVVSCLAYCYDVPKLPSGAPAPTGIHLQELDLRVDEFNRALEFFDSRCEEELRRSAMDGKGQSIDFMPRMETFLVSSFLLAFRQSAMHVLEMLRHVRGVVEERKSRKDRSRLWLPQHTNIRQWLTTGGETDGMVLPETARKEIRRGKAQPGSKTKKDEVSKSQESLGTSHSRSQDEESGFAPTVSEKSSSEKKAKTKKRPSRKDLGNTSWVLKLRGKLADILEWIQDSDDLIYAFKLALAVFSVSWPALVTSWNAWYSQVRGIWAPMQLILVFEVAIGSSIFIFLIRLFGVIFGCLVGFLSYEIGQGNRIVMVFILILGIVPSFYVQLGTKYVKTGMVSTVTMVVVALSAVDKVGPAYQIFYKRLTAFVIGGMVALFVEMFIYPVRARHRLLESLSAAVRQVQKMQAALAVGIDSPMKPDLRSPKLLKRFDQARSKARGALEAADTFLPFCSTEPRVKGSFKPLAPIYREIIYVLHQIIDRMDNMVQLRKEYGSSVLEDLNPKVHAYRRNAAASMMLVLFSVNEALTTWQPLPQFVPSSRLAQQRLVNHVREVLASKSGTQTPAGQAPSVFDEKGELDQQIARLITQKRFLSWNASTAGQMEIIEYLEELIELVKLLVGVNAFRSGLLEKPNYGSYRQPINMEKIPLAAIPTVESGPLAPAEEVMTAPAEFPPTDDSVPRLQRRMTLRERVEQFTDRTRNKKEEERRNEVAVESDSEDGDQVPLSLQRVGTRMWENHAVVRRRAFTMSHERRFRS